MCLMNPKLKRQPLRKDSGDDGLKEDHNVNEETSEENGNDFRISKTATMLKRGAIVPKNKKKASNKKSNLNSCDSNNPNEFNSDKSEDVCLLVKSKRNRVTCAKWATCPRTLLVPPILLVSFETGVSIWVTYVDIKLYRYVSLFSISDGINRGLGERPAWERGSIGHPIPRGPTGAKREVTKHGNDETHGSGF